MPLGGSLVLEAVAFNGSVDVTSSCSFTWKTSKNSVRVAVNKPPTTAVVTRSGVSVTGGSTAISATCNGVSGAFTLD